MVKKSIPRETDRLLTTREAKEILGIGWNALYTYIEEGKLKAKKLGGNGSSRRRWRIWYSDLINFIDGNRESNAKS